MYIIKYHNANRESVYSASYLVSIRICAVHTGCVWHDRNDKKLTLYGRSIIQGWMVERRRALSHFLTPRR